MVHSPVPVIQVFSRHTRVDATLDGLTFVQSQRRSSKRGIERVRTVSWGDVLGASIALTRKGRPVVRVAMRGTQAPLHHRDDPFSVKLRRKDLPSAERFVQEVNGEVEVRQRWRDHA